MISPTSNPGQVALWEDDGSLYQTFGSDGDGPGEMRGLPRVWVGPGDSIHVYDNAFTWSVFSPQGDFIRKKSGIFLGLRSLTCFLDDGAVLVASPPGSDTAFRILDRSGRLLREFGTQLADLRAPQWQIGCSGADTFWAVPYLRYELQEWSTDGELLRVLVRNAAWAPKEKGAVSPDRWSSPPVMGRPHVDADGFVWTTVSIPDPDADGTEAREDYAGRMDLVVEAIDPDAGAVVYSRTIDDPTEWFAGYLRAGEGYFRGEDDLGIEVFEVVPFRLVRGDGEK